MGISDVTAATSSLGSLLVVSPQQTIGYQPQGPNKSDGSIPLPYSLKTFLFHYEGEQTSSFSSDVTDHFVEDNTSIQDHMALHPAQITTHGYIGELNDIAPPGLAILQQIANKLVGVGAYAPQLSATALLAYNEAAFLENTALSIANAAAQTFASVNGIPGESVINGNIITSNSRAPLQSNQQVAYQTLYNYWVAKTLFTVQTPWAIFENMAIMNCRAVQSEETNSVTDFELTFKQIRFANDLAVAVTDGPSDQGTSTIGKTYPWTAQSFAP